MTLLELLAHFRATVQQSLTDAQRPDLNFDDSLIAAGAVAWDSCCGFLAVAPIRTYRYINPFPQEVVGDDSCDYAGIGVELSAVWLRCVPEIDDSGNPPSTMALQAAYDVLLNDHDPIWNALVSAEMVEMPGGWELERSAPVITWLGDQGGCVGLDARIQLGVDCSQWSITT